MNNPSTDSTALAYGITDRPMADVQAQIARVDTKASVVIGFTLAALTGGIAIVSKVHLPVYAALFAVMALVYVTVALVLLGTAIRPNLRGNYGFMQWATASDADDLRQQLHAYTDEEERAAHLLLMARSARTKYQRVGLAVDALGVALAHTLTAAALTALGW